MREYCWKILILILKDETDESLDSRCNGGWETINSEF